MAKDKDEKIAILRRLNRIEGQVRGIARMVQEDENCEDILVQIAAVKAAVDRVGVKLMGHKMKECLEQKGISKQESIDRAIDIFLRFTQTMGSVGSLEKR